MHPTVPPAYMLLLPLALAAFDLYCLIDLWRIREVRLLTKPQWVAAIVLLTPFSGISYLMLGREG